MLILKPHSFVDVITNSSSIIYSDYSGSVEAAKELIAECIKALGVTASPDDMFWFAALYDAETYIKYAIRYYNSSEEHRETTPDFRSMSYAWRAETCNKIIKQVAKCEIEKPDWMIYAEEKAYDDFVCCECDGKTFWLIPKETKYESLAASIRKFLYSPVQEACYEA